MTVEYTLIFYILLAIVAFLYASVGHGGASGYLALMALFSIDPSTMKSSALILNIGVSAVAFYQFYRMGYFKWSIFWPFILTSIPMAFIGGMITIDGQLYKHLLGVLLLFPVIRLLITDHSIDNVLKPINHWWAAGIGVIIGLVSGMIGIGGGILLSPILIFFKWADQKTTAATSALFILLNSTAGILGQYSKMATLDNEVWMYAVIALMGGSAGAYYGAGRIPQMKMKYILSVVLLIASLKLIFT